MTRRRVPLILQGSEVECAAASLAMIATYHGHHLSLRESREICATGRDGATAAEIVRAARGIGFTVEAYRADPGIVRAIPLPAIAHWGSDHFVVIERTRHGQVDITDAASGRRRMTEDQFHAGAGQVVITARPGPGFRSRPPAAAPFWRRYLRALAGMPGTRWPAAQILLASTLIQLLALALPAAVWVVISEVIPAKPGPVLPLLGAGLLIVVGAQLVASYLRAALIVYLQGRLDTQAMISFCAHLLRLPLSYFQRRSTGDIMLRIGCVGMLRELLTAQTLTSILDLMMIALYLAVIAAVSWAVALIVLAVIAAQAALLVISLPLARDSMAAELTAQGQATAQLTEVIEGITTVKAAAAGTQALDKWSALFVQWLRAALRRSHITALIQSSSGALRILAPLAVLLFTAARAQTGHMSLGTAITLTWLASAIVVPLATLASDGQRIQLAGAQLQRLADVLDTDPETPAHPAPASTRPQLTGQVTLDQVSFHYDPYTPAVLDEVSVTIEPGTRAAVVGVSGAGKTTMAMLILGLYQPTSGTIRLDSTDLAALDLTGVRAQIGTVLQDAFVFSGTIAENITFNDPAIPSAAIEHAATLACLHDEITALPRGYHTRLTERGGGLSGGQRQRLALARALVRRPALLILDEATSHLDTITETAIYRNLAALDCTQIVIAHRLSTIRDAGLILVMHDGRLVEQGTHDSLQRRGGQYTALIAAQLNGHRDTTSTTGGHAVTATTAPT